MALAAVTIDEQTLEEATKARRIEWEANIREFVARTQERFAEGVALLHITLSEQQFVIEARDAAHHRLSEHTIPHDLLAEHIQEYVDIVRQIDASEGLSRVEALDMAKKVTHDRAGRTLKRRLRNLEMSHQAARRLFTLLLSIKLDTTKLAGIYGHRRIR